MADVCSFPKMRQQTRPAADTAEGVMDTARVIRRDGADFLLLTSGAIALRGKKAAGCMLEPEDNDTVLVARNLATGNYILTVLERAGKTGRVMLDGDTTLSVSGGKLAINGDFVEIGARESATINAPEIAVKGVLADISVSTLSAESATASIRTGKLSIVSSVFDTVAARVTQRVRDCYRWVSGLDRTRAGQLNISSDGRMDLNASDMALLAGGEVKVDGEKIRLG